MKARAPDALRLARLHWVDAEFGEVTGGDLYLAGQVVAAIEAALGVTAGDEGEFQAAAMRLRGRLGRGGPVRGFHHCELSDLAGPLWFREAWMSGLKRLARFRSATLLITGLQTAVGGGAGRRKRAAVEEYAFALGFVAELARRRLSPETELRVLVL